MMKMLTGCYRVSTSLSIAAARLAEMMPAAHELPTGIVRFALDRQAQDEAVYLTLRPVSYHTGCGAWQVRVEPERMQWTHAGAQVTLTPDGESVFAGSEARERRARCCVMARLPDLRLPEPDFWSWRLDARLVAVTPDQVLIALWTFWLGDLLRSLEKRIKALWQLERLTRAQVNALSSGVIPPVIHPHPLRERREKVLRLRMEGKSLKQISLETGETIHNVKADLNWLRREGYL